MDLDNIREECEAIQAIYCSENETTTLVQDGDDTVHLAVTVVPSTRPAPVTVTFTVTARLYPDDGPWIRVQGLQSEGGPSGEDLRELQDHLQCVARTNLGNPMLLTLLTEVSGWQYPNTPQERTVLARGTTGGGEEVVEAGPSGACGGGDATKCSSSKADGSEKDSQLCVLSLQHMRSKGPYLRIMGRWCQQLGLVARVLFVRRAILVLLMGDEDDIKKYIQRNRTEIVDVDCKGRGCKERLLSVLHTVRIVHPKDYKRANIGSSKRSGFGIYEMESSNTKACKKQNEEVSMGTDEGCVIFDVNKVQETFKVIEVESKQDLEDKLKEDGMENLAKLLMKFL